MTLECGAIVRVNVETRTCGTTLRSSRPAKLDVEEKIEQSCTKDVERHDLWRLAASFGSQLNGDEYVTLLLQGELASVISATRETASTMLNTLRRRWMLQACPLSTRPGIGRCRRPRRVRQGTHDGLGTV